MPVLSDEVRMVVRMVVRMALKVDLYIYICPGSSRSATCWKRPINSAIHSWKDAILDLKLQPLKGNEEPHNGFYRHSSVELN